MKKFLSCLLISALLLAMIPFGVLAADAQPAGGSVGTAAELKNMNPDGIYSLSSDITITGEWSYAEFRGTLDGNGHVIYLKDAVLECGLFKVLKNATVRNLRIEQQGTVTFRHTGGGNHDMGVLAGRVNDSRDKTVTIENVIVKVDITNATNFDDIGGIVGNVRYVNNCVIHQCVYEGTISTGRFGGGIVGSTWDADKGSAMNLTISDCATYGTYTVWGYTAGILGTVQARTESTVKNLTLTGNINYANVLSTSSENAAGIIAYCAIPDGAFVSICNNINYGSVTATDGNNGNTKAGGIGGNMKQFGNGTNAQVSGNVNYGKITAKQVSPIVNNLYGGTGMPKAEHNYTVEMTDSGNNPIPKPTAVLNENSLSELNAAYPGTYVLLGNKITLKWAAELGYANVMPGAIDPVYVGYQLSKEAIDGKRNIRFVAGVNDTDADMVGMQLRVLNADGAASRFWLDSTAEVYTTVLAMDSTVTAAEYEVQYFYTALLQNIPESVGSVTFEIRTFTVKDGAVAYGEAVSVTVNLTPVESGSN